jgi:hypothetical protein
VKHKAIIAARIAPYDNLDAANLGGGLVVCDRIARHLLRAQKVKRHCSNLGRLPETCGGVMM